jgi:hypothetical protein
MGIIVGNGMVAVYGYTPVPIVRLTPTEVNFRGPAKVVVADTTITSNVDGSIDRVTGQTRITFSADTGSRSLKLACKPAHQMF